MAVRDLTDEQLSTLWHSDGSPILEGRTKILARPGTGKTFTVTTYCIDSVSMWQKSHSLWQGMAVLSYTNVAKNEIRKRIADEQQGAELLSFPHYIGTIDSFINQFIFLPFGSRVMNCKKRPTLIGEPHTPGKSINKTSRNKFGGIMAFDHYYYFYRTSYDLNGGLYLIGSDKQTNANGSVDLTDIESKIKIKSWVKVDGSYGAYSEKIHDHKQQQKLNGYATQADANFYSLKLLQEYEDIRMLVSSRFRSIIIDEAQDMTEIQHAIFDLLCNAEDPLGNCILIGDDAQAIYEWNTARPDLFTHKPQFTKKVLTNTFRCSQAVCDVLNMLEPLSPISPEGKNKGYLDKVKQIDWREMSEDVIRDTIKQFVECVSIKKPHDQKNEYLSVAVLARSRDLGSFIRSVYVGKRLTTTANSAKFSNETTKPFLMTAYYASKTEGRIFQAFVSLEKYWSVKLGISDKVLLREEIATGVFHLENFDMYLYRKEMFKVIKIIRKITDNFIKVSDFNSDNLDALIKYGMNDVEEIKKDCRNFIENSGGDSFISQLDIKAVDQSISVMAANGVEVRINIDTIHSVKGETYDGVLYFSKDSTGFCKGACPKNARGKAVRDWKSIATHNIASCESKRLLYVALSRASQSLWVCGDGDFLAIFDA